MDPFSRQPDPAIFTPSIAAVCAALDAAPCAFVRPNRSYPLATSVVLGGEPAYGKWLEHQTAAAIDIHEREQARSRTLNRPAFLSGPERDEVLCAHQRRIYGSTGGFVEGVINRTVHGWNLIDGWAIGGGRRFISADGSRSMADLIVAAIEWSNALPGERLLTIHRTDLPREWSRYGALYGADGAPVPGTWEARAAWLLTEARLAAHAAAAQ